jgi:hypothetical protein
VRHVPVHRRRERRVVRVGDGIELRRRDAGVLETPPCGQLGELPRREGDARLAVLAPREPLLLGSRDDDSVDDDRGGRIVEHRVDPEHFHGAAVPRLRWR